MGPTVFFSQLVLLGLLWLCVLLYYAWPSRCVASQQRPITSRRKRSHEPTPFAGLTQKPHCALCEHEAAHPKTSPPVPPDSMLPTNRRPREVDTSRHFCPHPGCPYRGWLGLGNLRANGHPSGGPWQQFHCTSCKGYFLETHGTLFHGKHVSPDKLVWAIAALAEGLGIRAVARVFAVDPNTVLAWRVDAADHLKAVANYDLYDIHVAQVQLEELCALLSAVKDDDVNEAQAIKRLSRSPHWVWVAMDPVSKLILTLDVGERTLAMAQRVVHQLVQVLAPACAPLFLSDGFRE